MCQTPSKKEASGFQDQLLLFFGAAMGGYSSPKPAHSLRHTGQIARPSVHQTFIKKSPNQSANQPRNQPTDQPTNRPTDQRISLRHPDRRSTRLRQNKSVLSVKMSPGMASNRSSKGVRASAHPTMAVCGASQCFHRGGRSCNCRGPARAN